MRAGWRVWMKAACGLAVAMDAASVAFAGATKINLSEQAQGTLPSGLLPAFTGGDCTSSAGSAALTCAKIGGKAISLAGGFSTSGAFTIALTATANTAVTLPTSGTLASLGLAQTWTGAQTFGTISATSFSTTGGVSFGASQSTGSTGVEIGSTTTAMTPYIDLHSSGTGSDYDVRLIASGGSSTAGQGTLAITAAAVKVGSDTVATLGASQVLINKTISGASNTFTAIPSSAITTGTSGATIPLLNGANIWSQTQSFSGGIKASARTVSTGSTDTASASDYIISWNSSTASVKTQNIPACSASNASQIYAIADAYGNAGSYSINLVPSAGTIGGASFQQIQFSGASQTIVCDGVSNWVLE